MFNGSLWLTYAFILAVLGSAYYVFSQGKFGMRSANLGPVMGLGIGSLAGMIAYPQLMKHGLADGPATGFSILFGTYVAVIIYRVIRIRQQTGAVRGFKVPGTTRKVVISVIGLTLAVVAAIGTAVLVDHLVPFGHGIFDRQRVLLSVIAGFCMLDLIALGRKIALGLLGIRKANIKSEKDLKSGAEDLVAGATREAARAASKATPPPATSPKSAPARTILAATQPVQKLGDAELKHRLVSLLTDGDVDDYENFVLDYSLLPDGGVQIRRVLQRR